VTLRRSAMGSHEALWTRRSLGRPSVSCVGVGSVTGAGFKMLRSVGKGVAVLSANEQYQKKRRKSFTIQASTAQEGFARAGRRLVIVI